MKLDAARTAIHVQSMTRRSIRAVHTVMTGAATAATRPGSVIISPAVPSETVNVDAIGISSPMGRISAVTMTKMPSMTENTHRHARSDVV